VVLKDVEIVGLAGEGNAIGRHEGQVVFTKFAAPGDVVDIEVGKRGKRHKEGRVVRFVRCSDRREPAFCSHYGVCGGCRWQIVPYNDQLKYKEQYVTDCLERIAKVEFSKILPILSCEAIRRYRNKLEFTFANREWREVAEEGGRGAYVEQNALGFHLPGRFDRVFNVMECHLQDSIQDDIRNEIRSFADKRGYEFFDLRFGRGFLRNIVIRTSSTGEVMLIVAFGRDDKEKREEILRHIAQKFPDNMSIIYTINEKANDFLGDLDMEVYFGRGFITERLGELQFRVGPKSFYQTNSRQAERLYGVVREFAQLTGIETVYDLYTGAGTIACFIAKDAERVIGIEYVEDAVADARVNAALNGIKNVSFYAGDMKNVLNDEFVQLNGAPDVIIADPPRAGMTGAVINALMRANPQRIVYVSCNPATMARDVGLLAERYAVSKVQAVDMFPHTHHVECVVLLSARLEE
ncbi:MAG: 23S rRNA (uracil(1939)-C(5))-methyltransferase RlmD, partial [Dysgonamonadaceae bacterium]|nr:23S rRNA (uracil(1939)-C(5))-methyltransferase RlmD [Dysgonamonadaceae bacterium]